MPSLRSEGTESHSCGMLKALSTCSSLKQVLSGISRYLTKITQQTVAFISPEHSSKIILDHDEDMEAADMDDEDEDRLFSFEVEKTKEQDEDVQMRSGFSVRIDQSVTAAHSTHD
jgi:hypothetical protein